MEGHRQLDDDVELKAAEARLAELQSRAQAAVKAYSAALKEAARAGWPDDLTNAAERSLAAADALHKQTSSELDLIERHVFQRYGISLADLDEKTRQRFDSRFWKSQLDGVDTTGMVEDSLKRGLDALLATIQPKWLRRQYALSQEELKRRNTLPFILIGNARHEAVASPHPLGYALFLTDLFLNEKTEIEIYDAAFLVPIVAALCDRLEGITAVKGGYEKLREMLREPSGEFTGRVYELLVAGRAAEKGRDVEFIEPGSEVSADLRINDLGIPLVIECKFQSQWSATERAEIGVIQTIFARLCSEYAQRGMTAIVQLTLTSRICDVNCDEVFASISQQLNSLGPFGYRECEWGSLEVLSIEPEIEWRRPTRLYSPNYLSHVFQWSQEDNPWDGICATALDTKNVVTQRARLPFGLKWRLSHRADEWSKARDVMRALQEAANQVPVGEAGCLYVGFEDSHRSALADLRTKRIIEKLPNFYHRKRGANIQHLLVTRLYPRTLGDGKPDMIESCIPASVGESDTWPDLLPNTVFVPEPT
jgi:hypothetical protein